MSSKKYVWKELVWGLKLKTGSRFIEGREGWTDAGVIWLMFSTNPACLCPISAVNMKCNPLSCSSRNRLLICSVLSSAGDGSAATEESFNPASCCCCCCCCTKQNTRFTYRLQHPLPVHKLDIFHLQRCKKIKSHKCVFLLMKFVAMLEPLL